MTFYVYVRCIIIQFNVALIKRDNALDYCISLQLNI